MKIGPICTTFKAERTGLKWCSVNRSLSGILAQNANVVPAIALLLLNNKFFKHFEFIRFRLS